MKLVVTDSLISQLFVIAFVHPTYVQTVRHSSHWGGSLRNGLGNEQTCGMTLALAYVLHHLSAI